MEGTIVNMAKEFKISALRLKELEQELFYLKTTREKEVAEQIKEARSFGDLSENSEYDEAKNEQAKLYGRIAEVENILAHAVIIDESERTPRARSASAAPSRSRIWRRVTRSFTPSSARRRPTPWNAASPTIPRSASALLGHKVGDIVEVEAPIGVLKYKILTVEK